MDKSLLQLVISWKHNKTQGGVGNAFKCENYSHIVCGVARAVVTWFRLRYAA